jgi:predicted alpha/beta-hydrolase family hydrolase
VVRAERLALVIVLAAGAGACAGDPCVEEAAQARAYAVERFDAEDPAELSYANVVNRPARRAEIARLAYADALAACRALE